MSKVIRFSMSIFRFELGKTKPVTFRSNIGLVMILIPVSYFGETKLTGMVRGRTYRKDNLLLSCLDDDKSPIFYDMTNA